MKKPKTKVGWNLEIMFDDELRPINFQKPKGPRSQEGCSSYVYRITNTRDGKMYIGYHKAGDKPYFTSTKNEKFQEVLAEKTPNLLSFEILFWGSVKECKQYEYELLTSLNAAKSDLYYNLNNGQPGVKKINIELVNTLTDEIDDFRKHQKLKKHNYLTEELNIVEFSVEELIEIDKLQSRELEIDNTNLQKIINRIRNRIGNYDMPVIVENITIDGEFHDYLLISGNHTRTAYDKTKDENVGHTKNTLLKCVLITEDIHQLLQESEIWILSNNLNADYNVGKPFSTEDGVKECLEHEKKGHSWGTVQMRHRLMRLGLSPNQVQTVFDKVEDTLQKVAWEKEGTMVYDYINTREHKQLLNDVADNYISQGYFVIKSASGNPHLYRWVESWIQHQLTRIIQGLSIQERIKIVVYHTNIKSQTKWHDLFKTLIRPQHLPAAKDGHRFTKAEHQLITDMIKYPDFSYYEMPMKGKSVSSKNQNN
jgi:hypothetical protein